MKRTVHSRSVSINGELYQRLVRAVGRREKGGKGRISRTVDKLINDYINQQEGKQ